MPAPGTSLAGGPPDPAALARPGGRGGRRTGAGRVAAGQPARGRGPAPRRVGRRHEATAGCHGSRDPTPGARRRLSRAWTSPRRSTSSSRAWRPATRRHTRSAPTGPRSAPTSPGFRPSRSAGARRRGPSSAPISPSSATGVLARPLPSVSPRSDRSIAGRGVPVLPTRTPGPRSGPPPPAPAAAGPLDRRR